MVWYKSATADPGGQGFAKPDTTFTVSRNTLAANGLAGGAPRTFDIALYAAVPEVNSFVMGIAVCCLVGLTYLARRNRSNKAAA
jgi:hypothetical protein